MLESIIPPSWLERASCNSRMQFKAWPRPELGPRDLTGSFDSKYKINIIINCPKILCQNYRSKLMFYFKLFFFFNRRVVFVFVFVLFCFVLFCFFHIYTGDKNTRHF